MPRKKLPNFRIEQDGVANNVHAAVQNLILKFPELTVLDPANKDVFSAALEEAVRCADTGAPSSRADISHDAWTRQILFADVQRAMKDVGLPVASWRCDATARAAPTGEALFYRVARAVAKLSGLKVPRDAFRLKKQSDEVIRS